MSKVKALLLIVSMLGASSAIAADKKPAAKKAPANVSSGAGEVDAKDIDCPAGSGKTVVDKGSDAKAVEQNATGVKSK